MAAGTTVNTAKIYGDRNDNVKETRSFFGSEILRINCPHKITGQNRWSYTTLSPPSASLKKVTTLNLARPIAAIALNATFLNVNLRSTRPIRIGTETHTWERMAYRRTQNFRTPFVTLTISTLEKFLRPERDMAEEVSTTLFLRLASNRLES